MLCMLSGLVLQEGACENPSGTHCCRFPCVWSSLDPGPSPFACHLPVASFSETSSLQPQIQCTGLLEGPCPPELVPPLVLIGQQSTCRKPCNWGLVPTSSLFSLHFLIILSVSRLFQCPHSKEFSCHCELCWLSAFTCLDHKPPCSFLNLSPTYHPKEPFWPVVKRIRIIYSVLGAQTH